MTPSDFHPGDHVRYIPGHAHGDRHHPDCEDGVVSSTNDRYVFVKFSLLALNGQACDSADLVKLMPAADLTPRAAAWLTPPPCGCWPRSKPISRR